LGISNLSTGLSLDRLEPATSVRTVETYSSNKDAERDSRGNDSPGGESPRHDSAENDSSQNDSADRDSLSRDSSSEELLSKNLGRDEGQKQLDSFVPDPNLPAEAPGNENANPEPAHKIDRLA